MQQVLSRIRRIRSAMDSERDDPIAFLDDNSSDSSGDAEAVVELKDRV